MLKPPHLTSAPTTFWGDPKVSEGLSLTAQQLKLALGHSEASIVRGQIGRVTHSIQLAKN